MILTPFRYPGSKNKLLPQIVPFIEQSIKNTNNFCDAFVGGGSVLLAIAEKYPKISLACNDKDYFISCFWKIVSSDNEQNINELKQLIEQEVSIELFYKLREAMPQTEVEAAYRGIFFNRTSFSGDTRRSASPIGGKLQKSKYTVDCRYNAKKINQKIDNIHKLLVGRTIVNNNDINQYSFLQDEQFTVYLDPPYYKAGKMLYEEYMKPIEHKQLASILQKRTNWVLSYDNCNEILDLYSWASINFINASYCIRGSKISWHNTKETLILPA